MYGSILITSIIGGFAAVLWTFQAGAGVILCLLAYGVGGAVSLIAAAALHLAFPEREAPTGGPRGGSRRDPNLGKAAKVRVPAQRPRR